MRLRPSGRSGPVATRLDAFAQYQDFEAWTWEHMALTRARVVSAPPAFREKIEAVITSVLMRPREKAHHRQRRARDAPGDRAGEGRRRHLGSQICRRRTDRYRVRRAVPATRACRRAAVDSRYRRHSNVLDAAARLGMLPQQDADVLRPAMRLYQDLNQILRLCLSERFQARQGGRRPAAAADARRRRAGFFGAGGAIEGDARPTSGACS